jgi:hypothetical protein
MKDLIIWAFFFAYLNTTINKVVSSHLFSIQDKSQSKVVVGKIIDSLQGSCNIYADCNCAEAVRIVTENSFSDTLIVLIRCPDDRWGFDLSKDSSYCFTLKQGLEERVLIFDRFDKIAKGKRYWCEKVKLPGACK